MPKKDKKEKARPKKLEEASHDSAASEEVPYVETLREKFMQNHDQSIMLRPEERLSLEWRQITYRVPIVKRTCCKVKERTEKAILNDVSGYLPAGSLLVRQSPLSFTCYSSNQVSKSQNTSKWFFFFFAKPWDHFPI